MELKLARVEIDSKPKTVKMEKILEKIEKDGGDKMFYFDKTNSHKDLVEFVENLEEFGLSVYFREIRYGLDEEDYIYQVHVL